MISPPLTWRDRLPGIVHLRAWPCWLGFVFCLGLGIVHYNFTKAWRVSKHVEGIERLMRPSEFVDVAIYGPAIGVGWLLLQALHRRQLPAWLPLPWLILGLIPALVAPGPWERHQVGTVLVMAGMGMSLGAAAYLLGWPTRARRTLGLRRRRAVYPWLSAALVAALLITVAGLSVWMTHYMTQILQQYYIHVYDTSNLNQSMWTLANYGVPITTTLNYHGLQDLGYFWYAEHLTPIQYLLLPFYYPFQTTESLFVILYTFVALSVVPLLFAHQAMFRHWPVAVVLTAAWWFHLQSVVAFVNGFHYETFAPVFIFAAFYFYVKRRPIGMVVMLLVSFTVKESAPLAAMSWGLTLTLFDRERRWWGLGILAVGAVYFVGAMTVMIHWARGGVPLELVQERYGWLAVRFGAEPIHTTGDLVKLVVTHPMYTLAALVEDTRWMSYVRMWAPLGLIFLLRPWVIGFFMPLMGMHLLTDFPPQYDFAIYHSIELTPWMAIAVATALHRPWIGGPGLAGRRRVLEAAALCLILSTLGGYTGHTPLPGGGTYDKLPPVLKRTRDWAPELYERMRSVPPEVAVASIGNNIVPLSSRLHSYHFPEGIDVIDEIIVVTLDKATIPEQTAASSVFAPQRLVEVMESGQWSLKYPYDPAEGVLWLERRPGPPIANAREIVKFLLKLPSIPPIPRSLDDGSWRAGWHMDHDRISLDPAGQ